MEPTVFALHGADPEILAYAMAKYSRSALSMKEAIGEINAQKASDFLNSFYFAYGHKSIADLAHTAFAVENVSLLAAIEVVDEQCWDGQERSTRYQDFSKREYYRPVGFTDEEYAIYDEGMKILFDGYDHLFQAAYEDLCFHHSKPDDMSQVQYERTLRARAFDIARYLLPMGTLTSVGQVVNARTLEGQISRLLGSEYNEVIGLGHRLKDAATEPAYNVNHPTLSDLFETLESYGSFQELGGTARKVYDQIKQIIMRPVSAAPTLVKYTEPLRHLEESRAKISHIADGLHMPEHWLSPNSNVYLVEFDSIEQEIAATLLYEVSNIAMKYIVYALRKEPAIVNQVIAIALEHRGKFDELSRAFRAGQGFCFDIEMDIGGYRDFHRHRRCIQFRQAYSFQGTAVIPGIGPELRERTDEVIRQVFQQYTALKRSLNRRYADASDADYLMPLGTNVRFLMKMDLAELAYITELRTGPAGHPSYRKVAWSMFVALRNRHSWLAEYLRVTDFDQPIDIFKR